MARLTTNPANYLKQQLGKKSRVLLINPPVEERRYHWLRWNQPAELLKLSSWMKSVVPGIDVRLFDFMFPDEGGMVPKHKVKETWRGQSDDAQLWHFGQLFETFENKYNRWSLYESWRPDVIVITSLTSYWHTSIEKLLTKLCTQIGKPARKRVKICLYGNYPRIEPEHAAEQQDADIAFTESVDTHGYPPDVELYLHDSKRLPQFFGLDIEDPAILDHLQFCLQAQATCQKQKSGARPIPITVAFFNDNVFSPSSQIEKVAEFVQSHPKQLLIEGIAGILPHSLTADRLMMLKAAGFRSLFVEHARREGGELDLAAYEPLLDVLRAEDHAKKCGRSTSAWLDRGNVTGFVAMGLADDNIDSLVRSTLRINSYFQSVILKPYGYSPTIDNADVEKRRQQWKQPLESSPQRFPYVGHGTLLHEDYENLIRWQNLLNKRVKGTTFDFLGSGTLSKLVRETLVAESWKRHREGA